MEDYSINVNRLAWRLIPPFVRKPIARAFVHALLRPLYTVNQHFLEFVTEKRIEANMNSQTMLMEHYLNRAFSRFLSKETGKIYIVHSVEDGLPVFFEIEEGVIDPVIYDRAESFDGVEVQSLSFLEESSGSLPYNFRVMLPVSFEGNVDLVGQIVQILEKYKIGGFGYDIIYI